MNRLRSLSNAIQEHLPSSDAPRSEQDLSGVATFPRPSNPKGHMLYALEIAKQATAKSTNFSIGAVIVDEAENHILVTGYTNELPGNTHAEECALQKLNKKILVSPSQWLSPDAKLVLYTTMEPCNKRSSENSPCTETIITYNQQSKTRRITKVYYGVSEPEKFVGTNTGQAKLHAAGIQLQYVPGLDKEILEVATAGHHPTHSPALP